MGKLLSTFVVLLGVSLWALAASAADTSGASLTSYYTQTYYRAIEGRGDSCRDARTFLQRDLHRLIEQSTKDPMIQSVGFTQAMNLPHVEIGTCGPCAQVGNYAFETTCLASMDVQYFINTTVKDKEKVYSGKPHGATLSHIPQFAGYGEGLDCFEAEHLARVDLFENIEISNAKYEYGRIQYFNCKCDRTTYPFVGTCRADIDAIYGDARVNN